MRTRFAAQSPLGLAFAASLAVHLVIFGASLVGRRPRVGFERGSSGLTVHVIPSVASRAATPAAPQEAKPVQVTRSAPSVAQPARPMPRSEPLTPSEAPLPRSQTPVTHAFMVEVPESGQFLPRPGDYAFTGSPKATKTDGDHPRKDIEQPADIRGLTKPQYPLESRRLGEQGTVVVLVDVGADGKPHAVSIVESSGYSRLDEAALHATKEATYIPATRAGRPVASQLHIAFTFRLTDAK